jgi:hypothetical protein
MTDINISVLSWRNIFLNWDMWSTVLFPSDVGTDKIIFSGNFLLEFQETIRIPLRRTFGQRKLILNAKMYYPNNSNTKWKITQNWHDLLSMGLGPIKIRNCSNCSNLNKYKDVTMVTKGILKFKKFKILSKQFVLLFFCIFDRR